MLKEWNGFMDLSACLPRGNSFLNRQSHYLNTSTVQMKDLFCAAEKIILSAEKEYQIEEWAIQQLCIWELMMI